jgi:hypothetical protein
MVTRSGRCGIVPGRPDPRDVLADTGGSWTSGLRLNCCLIPEAVARRGHEEAVRELSSRLGDRCADVLRRLGECDYLNLDDLLVVVDDLNVDPVRDVGLLDSAAHRPTTHVWGREAYPSLDEKAAALLESLVGNHALVDSNKRLG